LFLIKENQRLMQKQMFPDGSFFFSILIATIPALNLDPAKYIAIFLKRRRKIGGIGFSTESGKMLIDALLKVICRIHVKFIIQSLALSLFYFFGFQESGLINNHFFILAFRLRLCYFNCKL
jgi:hypothetical protein